MKKPLGRNVEKEQKNQMNKKPILSEDATATEMEHRDAATMALIKKDYSLAMRELTCASEVAKTPQSKAWYAKTMQELKLAMGKR